MRAFSWNESFIVGTLSKPSQHYRNVSELQDEPRVALDAQAEYDVYLRFQELTRGCTTLLISHRFSTMHMADRILVLEGGRISDGATHDELVTPGGRYATLWEMQVGRCR
jgi:ATP-binding cassette, subfamily B, bacterial